jgi:hypothetical protein
MLQTLEIYSLYQKLSPGCLFGTEDEFEQGGLAGSTATCDKEKIAFIGVQGDIIQGVLVTPVTLIHVIELNHGQPLIVKTLR